MSFVVSLQNLTNDEGDRRETVDLQSHLICERTLISSLKYGQKFSINNLHSQCCRTIYLIQWEYMRWQIAIICKFYCSKRKANATTASCVRLIYLIWCVRMWMYGWQEFKSCVFDCIHLFFTMHARHIWFDISNELKCKFICSIPSTFQSMTFNMHTPERQIRSIPFIYLFRSNNIILKLTNYATNLSSLAQYCSTKNKWLRTQMMLF